MSIVKNSILPFALVASVASSSAFAYPSYLGNFTGYYSENGLDVTKFKDGLKCQTCHTNKSGGERNSYGRDIESALGSGNTFGSNEFKDSDSDGYVNFEEIFAQTAPGFAEIAPAGRIEIKASAKGIVPATIEVSLPISATADCDVTLKAFQFKFAAPTASPTAEQKQVSDLILNVNKGEKILLNLEANSIGTILAKCDAASFVGSLTLAQ